MIITFSLFPGLFFIKLKYSQVTFKILLFFHFGENSNLHYCTITNFDSGSSSFILGFPMRYTALSGETKNGKSRV